jgi:hypothetical protein
MKLEHHSGVKVGSAYVNPHKYTTQRVDPSSKWVTSTQQTTQLTEKKNLHSHDTSIDTEQNRGDYLKPYAC